MQIHIPRREKENLFNMKSALHFSSSFNGMFHGIFTPAFSSIFTDGQGLAMHEKERSEGKEKLQNNAF